MSLDEHGWRVAGQPARRPGSPHCSAPGRRAAKGLRRTFCGYRPQPPEEYRDKGITNAGRAADYEGVIFTDGTVAIRWQTAYRSHSVWSCWDDFWQVHGHPEYGTVIEFDDGLCEPGPDEEGQE
jgi:hypothetical protein